MIDPLDLPRAFEAMFGRRPRLYRAPGRVNLIGEHTDYNDGFVMPMALDRSTWVAAAPRGDRTLVARSREQGETVTVDLDADQKGGAAPGPRWIDYVRGVATVLDRTNPMRGAELLIASDVPMGAGLSSSAALEVACGYALADLMSAPVDLTALAHAGQQAEHEFVGTRCGIMDQMIACLGREGHALLLDTRSLDCRHVPIPSDARVVICNTMVSHHLASAEYNARRADCEAGVAALKTRDSRIRALRDVTPERLQDAEPALGPRVFRRCRHVITENLRVEEAARALSTGNCPTLGRLMNESHESLRSDYEVSCAELDTMAAIARGLDGVYGARMTGGGFGGCVVALVDARSAAQVEQRVVACYQAATRVRPDVWITAAGRGVSTS